MRNTLPILFICVGIQFWFGCGEDKSTSPQVSVPHYELSGTVFPWYTSYGQYEVQDLTMAFVDSEHDTVTTITDNFGQYAVDALARGSVEISMFSVDTIFTDPEYYRDLPLYMPASRTITLTQDTVINLQIKRLEAIFADMGYNPEKWVWEYGVSNEEGKYVFWYDWRGSDMRMVNNVHVPEDARQVGFVLLGQAGHSGVSTMKVYLVVNGVRQASSYSTQFSTTERYWIEPLPVDDEGIEGVLDDDIRLELVYERNTADFIYIKGIFLYIY